MKEEYNFGDLTFCIPIRIDSPQRLRNLCSVLRFYSSCTNAKFMVYEADSSRKLFGIENIPNLDYVFIKDDNRIFHRTKLLNMMMSEATTKYAGIWDSDAVSPIEQIHMALECLRANKTLAMVYPFDGKFWNVSDYFADLFYASLDIRLITDYPQPKQLLYGYHAVGGAFIVNIPVYKQYGWENEYFIGWGPEDAERYRRLEILGNTPIKIKGDLYHLEHPRGINSGNSDRDLSLSTRMEYAKVCSMERKELLSYVRTWPWI